MRRKHTPDLSVISRRSGLPTPWGDLEPNYYCLRANLPVSPTKSQSPSRVFASVFGKPNAQARFRRRADDCTYLELAVYGH